MKKMLFIIPITFLALLLIIGMGNKKCRASPINPIVLIDSTDGDETVDVDITVVDTSGENYGLWYNLDSEGWTQIILTPGTYPMYSCYLDDLGGGKTLVFGLDTDAITAGMGDDGDLVSNDSADATLTFSGVNTDITIENPSGWPYTVYNSASINWTGVNYRIEFLTPVGTDGVSQVPIPTSVLLLGAGLLGLIGIGYRKRKSTAE